MENLVVIEDVWVGLLVVWIIKMGWETVKMNKVVAKEIDGVVRCMDCGEGMEDGSYKMNVHGADTRILVNGNGKYCEDCGETI